MIRRLAPTASILAVLLVPALAFCADPPAPGKDFSVVQSGFIWPEGIGSGQFGRCEIGQITEDMVLDAITVRGPSQPPGAVDDLVALLYGPANHRGVIPLPNLVADFAVVDGAGPDGRDAIAMLREHGVSLATVPDGADQFKIVPLATPEFAGGLRLRAADCDADGDCDILGLRSDGRALLIAENTRNGFPVHVLPLPGSITASDFVFVDAGTPGSIQFAVLDPFGLVFLATNPTWVAPTIVRIFRTDKSRGSLAPIRSSAAAPQRVAWVTGQVGSPKQLLLVADSKKLDPVALGFAGEGIAAITCSDLDQDGDEDAIVTRTSLAGALELESVATLGGATFSLDPETHHTLVPLAVPTLPEPAQSAWPASDDLDHDGDREVLVACEGSHIVGLIDGAHFPKPTEGFDGPPPIPSVTSSDYDNDPVVGFEPQSSANLRLRYAIPSGLGPDYRLEVVVWRQSAYQAPVAPDAIGYAQLPIPPSTSGKTSIDFTFDVAESDPFPFLALLWFESRVVRIDPFDGRIVEAFPASVYAFGAAVMSAPGSWPIGPSIPSLMSEPDSGPMIPVMFVFPTAGAVQCGGLVPKAAVPYFPSGPSVPRPHGSSSGGQNPGGGG